MSHPTRLGAVLLAGITVLAVATPMVAATEPPTISVTQDQTTYTVTVEHNGTPVNGSTVEVTANDPNSTYAAGPASTDGNGTVTFDLPSNETNVTITATYNGSTFSATATLTAGDDAGQDGPFGQLLTSWLHNLMPSDNDKILGLTVAEFVTENNPGSEHRSDRANPGGNATGPPEHAGNQSADKRGNASGPPDHAKNASEDRGGNASGDRGNASDSGNAGNASDNGGNASDSGNAGNASDNGGNASDNGNGGGNSGGGNDGNNGNGGQGNGNDQARDAAIG